MSVRGIKATTKDTDVVVEGIDIHALLGDLRRAGYEPFEDPASIVFDNYVIVYREGGIRIDLFPPTRIFDGPGWTDAMRTRSEPWFYSGGLTLRLADPSTVFLLKSITGRWRQEPGRDLDDLRMLLARGLVDWDAVSNEWEAFRTRSPEVVAKAREAVGHLRGEGRFVGWDP